MEASNVPVVGPMKAIGHHSRKTNRHTDLSSPGSRDSAGFSEVEWWFYRAHVECQYRTSDLLQIEHGWDTVNVVMLVRHLVPEQFVGDGGPIRHDISRIGLRTESLDA